MKIISPKQSSYLEAIQILNDLEKQGLTLVAKTDRLLVKPSRKKTENSRSLIHQNKSNLLSLIKPQSIEASQIKSLRYLYQPPEIKAGNLLMAIKPRSGTSLGLPRETLTSPGRLKAFLNRLMILSRCLDTLNFSNSFAICCITKSRLCPIRDENEMVLDIGSKTISIN